MKYLTDFRKTVETGMDPRSVHQGIKECLSMYIAILVLFSYDLTQHLFSPPPPQMQTIYPKNNVL